MLVGLAAILILGLVAAPGYDGRTEFRQPLLAQSFDLPADDDSPPTRPKKKKKKKKRKEIKTEDDIWSAPAGEKDEDHEDEDKPAGRKTDKEDDEVGGWGADVERDSWGDEHRLDNKPLGQEGDEGDEKPGRKDEEKEKDEKADEAGDKSDKSDKEDEEKPGEDSAPEPGEPVPGDQGEPGVEHSREDLLQPSGTIDDLALVWEQRRIHLDQRDFTLAGQDLQRFCKLRNELAIKNMFLQANVLIREAERARQREDDELAAGLLSTVVDLAPDLPAAHLARAGYQFAVEPLGLGRVFSGLVGAGKAALRNPLVRIRLTVNLIVSLLLGLGLAVGLFCVVQLLRYLKLFLHDFHHLFPRGVAFFQTGILGILIVLLPVFFRAGLVVILLTWLLIAWIYQNWRERVLSVVVLACIAGAPFALKHAVHGLALPDTTFGDVVEIVRGSAPAASVSRIKARLIEEPDNHVLLAVLGDYYKRTGELEKARKYYQRAVQKVPGSEVLLNNLGNVLFLRDDLIGALAQYRRATVVRPDQVVPYFNLSRTYFRSANLDKGKESAEQAIRLDQDAVRKMREQADLRLANYAVADLPLPSEWLALADGRGDSARLERAVTSLWRASAGSGSLEAFWFTAAGAVVLFILMLFARAKLFASSGCVRCGRPVCLRCTPELRDDAVCGQCFHAFVKKTQVDARARISKEIQIRQFRRRRESIARGITFVLPGLGQMMRGKTLRGALILLVFCLVLMQILVGDFVMRDHLSVDSGRNWLLLVPQLVVFACFYAWAIVDVFRAEEY